MLSARGLAKQHAGVGGALRVLDDVSFDLRGGEALAVMGPSGSGKSTLLHILGTLERPSAGTLQLDGRDLLALDEPAQAAFRNRSIGFVFQDHCLLPQLDLLENVLLPTLASRPTTDLRERAGELLARVGLSARANHRPDELSGGEKQRAALARALLLSPRLLLCDEPTGNLDARSAEQVAEVLLELQGAHDALLVVVTHSVSLATRFARRAQLVDGRLVEA
jgi:lipoprotein-releasing system ATP-binding protein